MTADPRESDLEWMLAALRLGAGNQTVFEGPASCPWHGHTVMQVAILHGRADVVRFLCQEYGPDIDALATAVSFGRREIAELLVSLGAELVPPHDNIPLTAAAASWHDDLFYWLLDRGTPVTGRAGQDTLRHACLLLREDIVRVLIDRGAEAEPPGESLVGHVCKLDHEKPEVGRIVRFLLDYGADPNGRLGQGDTPLITACRFPPVGPATVEIADTLLNAGADPNRRNLLGETALMLAAQGGYLPLVELLVRFGADVNARTEPVRTPLSLARARGRSAVADFLRRNGGTE